MACHERALNSPKGESNIRRMPLDVARDTIRLAR